MIERFKEINIESINLDIKYIKEGKSVCKVSNTGCKGCIFSSYNNKNLQLCGNNKGNFPFNLMETDKIIKYLYKLLKELNCISSVNKLDI